MSLLGSSMRGDDVALKAKYKVKLPVSFLLWMGYGSRIIATVENGQERTPVKKRILMCFYTDYGNVYHLSEQCNYLDLSIKEHQMVTGGGKQKQRW